MNAKKPAQSAGMVTPRSTGVVELRIPASSAYLALVRATTNSTCARLDFTLERLDDVTLAVDEAASLLIGDAVAGTLLTCRWMPSKSGVTISITSVSSAGRPPRTTSFAWTVLKALVDEADATIDDGLVTVSLTTARDWPQDDPVS